MSGSAVISLEKAEDVLAVPVNAISTKGGMSFVTLKAGDKEALVEVETGISNGTYTEIKSGLSEGDIVSVTLDENGKTVSISVMGGSDGQGFQGEPPEMPEGQEKGQENGSV